MVKRSDTLECGTLGNPEKTSHYKALSKIAAIKQERRRIEDLNPAAYNPRKRLQPGDDEYENLKRSIEAFGYVDPIIINADGTVIGGHQRLNVLNDLGYTEVDVSVVDVDKNTEKALNVALNKIVGDWDNEKLAVIFADLDAEGYDLSLTGYEESEYTDLMSALTDGIRDAGMCDPDELVLPRPETTTRKGDMWLIGEHRLLCGDSTSREDVSRLMDGKHSRLLFTSPPYSDMRTYNGHKDLSENHIARFVQTYAEYAEIQAVNLGIQIKNSEVNPYWDIYIKLAREAGLKLLSWNVWDKLQCGSVGQQKAMIPIRHEFIFVFGECAVEGNRTWKKKEASVKPNGSKRKVRQADGSMKASSKGRTDKKFKRMESVLEIMEPEEALDDIDLSEFDQVESVTKVLSERGKIRSEHPATFPVGLPTEYILSFTDRGDIVVEPFGGSGTTMIACEQKHRVCYSMELDPQYCDVIVRRYMQFTGKHDVTLLRDDKKIPVEKTGIS